MNIIDIHTHNIKSECSLISVTPAEYPNLTGGCFSVGIHPWYSDNVSDSDLSLLADVAMCKNIYAIGECGLDSLRGAAIKRQKQIFEYHIRLSEELSKPLIIHQVKTVDEIIFFRKKYSPSQRWLIHGFRGKPTMAEQLLKLGFDISFGPNFNTETMRIIPMKSLFLESDNSENFTKLLSYASKLYGVSENELRAVLLDNCNTFLHL